MARVPIISFFTGGGFLDLGMEQAGFSVVWTNEYNDTFADMYESAMSGWRKSTRRRPYNVEVSSRDSIVDLVAKDVLVESFPRRRVRPFGVVGGPPCPDFSNGGTHSGGTGENGRLTKTFVEMILELQPDFFVIENVAGLFRFRKHRSFLDRQMAKLRSEGRYVVDLALLNALELGVAQYRERVFVIGCRKKTAERAAGHAISWEELGWFPWPSVPEYADVTRLRWPKIGKFRGKPKKPDSIPEELTVYGAFLGQGDPEELPNGEEYYNSYSDKFWERAEGDVSAKSFKRLHRYRYSPTAWYGNQEVHLHPWKARRLSVREAMRIQSIPDEYILPEDEPLSAKFKMICNGVPCRMAELLGRELFGFLKKGAKQA